MKKNWALLIVISMSALACTDSAENEPTAADESTSTAATDDNGAPDLVLSEPAADSMTDGDALAPLAFNEDCTPDQTLWTDAIKPVVSKFCGDCHGETTQFGANQLCRLHTFIRRPRGQTTHRRACRPSHRGHNAPAGSAAAGRSKSGRRP